MLQKKNRVTKELFASLLKDRKPFSTQLFLFYSKQSGDTRFAFVAPKSIFKKAFKRNKFRRIGYNILRSIKTKPINGVFIYKKQALLASQDEIKNEIVSVLEKLNLKI